MLSISIRDTQTKRSADLHRFPEPLAMHIDPLKSQFSSTYAIPQVRTRSVAWLAQNNHTYQNSRHTAAKKPNQAFQPTPVFCAIRNILFIVPFNRMLVFSKERFIVSASAVESRISAPIAVVSWTCQLPPTYSVSLESRDTTRW